MSLALFAAPARSKTRSRRTPAACALALLLAAPALSAQGPVPPTTADAPFVYEWLRERLRFEADGTGRIELSVRTRVQTEAALDAFGQLTFPYQSANQRLSVDSVRVFKAGGASVLAPASAVQDLSGPMASEAPMYSDTRIKVVTVPSLRPGDTLEYHVTWTTHTPIAPGNFWMAERFVRAAPILEQVVVVDVPRAADVVVRTRGAVTPSIADAEARRVYTWRWSHPSVDTTGREARREASRPPDVLVTSFRRWDDVGAWYGALERPREAVTPALHAVADSLVRGRRTLRDSIAAIYDYVALDFRYVSLSFGVGRYQPHEAAEVLANQYGDCKDKHTLMAALLRAIGVGSAPALISSDTPIDTAAPSPLQFDHVITFVPLAADTLWLDATAGTAPFGHLLSPLRGRRALVIPEGAPARLVRTPAESPYPEFAGIALEGSLSDADVIATTVREQYRGDGEVLIRTLLQQIPAARLPAFASQAARAQGLRGDATDFEAGDPRATAEPATFSFHLEQRDAVGWQGLHATLWLPLPRLSRNLSPDTTDDADSLDLRAGEVSYRITLQLPEGVRATLPLGVSLQNDEFAEYHSIYRLEGRTLTAVRILRVRVSAIPIALAPRLAAMKQAVQDDEAQTVALQRARPAPAPAPAPPAASADEAYRAGQAAMARRPYDAAVALRRAVALDPRHAAAWKALGDAELRLSEYDSAAVAFRRHLALAPDDGASRNDLGYALRMSGHLDEAEAEFRRQLEARPLDVYAHRSIGLIALDQHRDSVAVAELRRVTLLEPRAAWYHVDLGDALLDARDSAQALESYDHALELDSGNTIRNRIAASLARAGVALERAQQLLGPVLDSASAPLAGVTITSWDARAMSSAMELAETWNTYGWILFGRGDVAGAERWVRAAWLTGLQAQAGDHLGQILERLGRRDEAIRTYTAALAAEGRTPEIRAHLRAAVGNRARADRIAQGANAAYRDARTIALGRVPGTAGAAEAVLLIGPGPKVEAVFIGRGPASLHRAEDALRAADVSGFFPDGAAVRVLRHGLLNCTPRGCTFIAFEFPMAPVPTVQ